LRAHQRQRAPGRNSESLGTNHSDGEVGEQDADLQLGEGDGRVVFANVTTGRIFHQGMGAQAPLPQPRHWSPPHPPTMSAPLRKLDCVVLLSIRVKSMHENFEPWNVRTL
jgi:hypothetical protein